MGTEVVFPGSPNGIVATCPPTLNQYDSSGTAGNNPCPVIVICVPIFPDVGVIDAIYRVRVKKELLLGDIPDTLTTKLPLAVPLGTVATMLVSLQLVTTTFAPLKVTALVPCVAPNPDPVNVTAVPGTPEVGDIDVISGWFTVQL